jgi:imidazole glycerol-phosphate synthase subunit HisH
MKVGIIKYNAGNIQSVIYALNRLGVDPVLTDDEAELKSCDKVIFPGVGEASSAMRYLRAKGLDEIIPKLTQPTLGICIGQQLMCEHSEEGDTDCLGIFPLQVKKFTPINAKGEKLKVPHMGWNAVHLEQDSPLFKGVSRDDFVYYVHSFYCELGEETMASTDYAVKYSASLHKDNFYALQFHPEKSGKTGQQILKNFLEL